MIGAFPEGLFELRAGKVQRLSKENGLPCDVVTGFLWDNNKHLWLSTLCGFVELDDSEVQRWKAHPDTIVQSQLFDSLDGARPGAAAFNSAAKTRDGRLWFVNNTVLQMIDPAHLSGDATVPPVYVEAVVADRKQYKPQEGLQLPPLTRDLQIDYTRIAEFSHSTREGSATSYKLEGDRDAAWQEPGTRRQAFYSDLRPGTYRFHVIACNNGGVWNKEGATLNFPAYPRTQPGISRRSGSAYCASLPASSSCGLSIVCGCGRLRGPSVLASMRDWQNARVWRGTSMIPSSRPSKAASWLPTMHWMSRAIQYECVAPWRSYPSGLARPLRKDEQR